MQKEISIIIPSYNCSQVIAETIESIKKQSFSHFECLIIDDHSTDSTIDTVTALIINDSRFKLISRPNNLKKGGNSCRNYGFEISTGNFIQWFDSDDIMHPRMLEEKITVFEGDTDFVVCQTIWFEDNVQNTTSKPTKIKSNNLFVDFFRGEVIFYTPGPLWKKDFLKKQNYLFDESLLNIQEWEFYSRLLLQNPKYKIVEKPLIYYRKHSNSIWGRARSKDKVVSEFQGRKKIFSAAGSFQKEISSDYFLHLGKLYKELKTKSSKSERTMVRKELISVFLKKKPSGKEFMKLMYWII